MNNYFIKVKKKKENYLIKNLDKNLGITIGNSLRRILITSLSGYSVSAIYIENVYHEYQSIKGIYEDIIDFIIRLKKLKIKIKKNKNINKQDLYIININLINKKKFYAKDIEKFTDEFFILNKKFLLLNFSKNIKFNFKIFITYGKGYVTSNENNIINEYQKKKKINLIKMDSSYSPVINVVYKIKKHIDNEDLYIKIKTNKTISSTKLLVKTLNILNSIYCNIIKCINKNFFFIKNFLYFKLKYLLYFKKDIYLYLKSKKIIYIKDLIKNYKILILSLKDKETLNLIKLIYTKYKYET
ncbi:MAG: hypothetical protein ABPD24_00605 [Candidatus Shikimatogenerans sp. AspAUS03]|uniref:DNA-directed RNA polymerase RpoA/D/Rpb3-type domain-containing protein n=1 Tax=Candidatus Shikimatogenerans sp. AspAUS03 TaxID=3158563 RepID=A0AAU7QST5_9FLAO